MNYIELNKVIEDSGMLRARIAREIGMKPKTFSERTTGKTKWRVDEMVNFCKLLKLTRSQMYLIFLS